MKINRTQVCVGGKPVDIQARWNPEKQCWGIVAYTPDFSIRSERLAFPQCWAAFMRAITLDIAGHNALGDAIMSVTGGLQPPTEPGTQA